MFESQEKAKSSSYHPCINWQLHKQLTEMNPPTHPLNNHTRASLTGAISMCCSFLITKCLNCFKLRKWLIFKKPIDCDFLLLEIPPILLIHKNQIQEVLHTKFVVDVAICWRQFIRTKEKSDWNWFSCKSISGCTQLLNNEIVIAQNDRTINHAIKILSSVETINHVKAIVASQMECQNHNQIKYH